MTHEQTIRAYYEGWENGDWEVVENLLADGFTFTSPYDDHIDKATYKKLCWSGVETVDKLGFLTIIENGDEAFVRLKGLINGQVVRNTEYLFFESGKIKAIEVYFGQPTKQ
jgi:hypothetical protein